MVNWLCKVLGCTRAKSWVKHWSLIDANTDMCTPKNIFLLPPSSCLLLSHAQEFLQVTCETDTSGPAYTTICHRLATVYSYMLLKTGFCLWVSTCVFHVTVSTKGPRALMGIAPDCLFPVPLSPGGVCTSLSVNIMPLCPWCRLSCHTMHLQESHCSSPVCAYYILPFCGPPLGWHSAVEWNTAVSLIDAFGAWRHKRTQPVCSISACCLHMGHYVNSTLCSAAVALLTHSCYSL